MLKGNSGDLFDPHWHLSARDHFPELSTEWGQVDSRVLTREERLALGTAGATAELGDEWNAWVCIARMMLSHGWGKAGRLLESAWWEGQAAGLEVTQL